MSAGVTPCFKLSNTLFYFVMHGVLLVVFLSVL